MAAPPLSETLSNGPHQGQPVVTTGAALGEARAAVVMIHGRGATAESILTLADELEQPGAAYLAPQAARRSWYPNSFLAPLEQNEPGLTSGLRAVADVLDQVEAAGVTPEQILLLGFSQGACLALEFAARRAWHGGGVVAFSGGLLGTGERANAPLQTISVSSTKAHWKARLSFLAAQTATRTFRCAAWKRQPVCWNTWAPT